MKNWKTAGAFVQGTGHEKKKIPCQDRISSIVDKDFAAISLADGAGSCSHSHIGAEIVTKTVCNVLKEKFDFLYESYDNFIKDYILYELLMKLGYMACTLNVDLTELSSTLLFIAVKENRYIAGHIGDGVIGVLDDDKLNVLSHPERGEYANTTYFITSSNALKHFRIIKGEMGNTQGFIILSDGSSESLYDKREKTLSLALRQMLSWLDEHEIYDVKNALQKNLENLLKKYTNDDCSINLMRLVKSDEEFLENEQRQFGLQFT